MSKFDELAKEWKEKVFDKSEEVDPSGRHDWGSMAVGFGLGKGLSPDAAEDFYYHLLSKCWV